MTIRLRHPVSTRHAFALAADLALRRDPLQSLIVPFLLRAPWVVALALIPSPAESDRPVRSALLWCAAALGNMLATLIVNAMLQFRARTVFNTPRETPAGSALECYGQGLARVPWLFLTEMVRGFAIAAGIVALVVPGVYAAFRLAFATEAVVLSDANTSEAVRRSFRLTGRRFERWLELMSFSILIVLGAWFALAVVMVAVRAFTKETWGSIGFLLAVALWPILQYAWTFFYLRLVELDAPGLEVGPLYAGQATHVQATATPGAQLSLVTPLDSGSSPEGDDPA